MTKEQTTYIKGIAILMMLFLHLFNHWNPGEYSAWLYIGDRPLVNIIARACSPVGIFLMLSGYGLHYVYVRNKLSLKGQVKRLLKIYIHYWLILLIFVSIGHYVNESAYPGSLSKLLLNVSSLSSSYNAETWFLFPYTLLSLTAPFVFRFINKWGGYAVLSVSFVLYTISVYIISRYIAPAKDYDAWYNFVLVYFDVLLSFVVGAVFHFYVSKGKWRAHFLEKHSLYAVVALVTTFIINCFFTISVVAPAFEFIYVFLLIHIKFNVHIAHILQRLGRQSMVMWMTHSFFCYHLFHDFIYGFKYPLVIYVVLIVISYVVSIPITSIAKQIISRLPFLQNAKA